MKIVIAPDSFKESLTAIEVASAIESGWKEIIPDAEYVKVPLADGGEGTTQSLVDATGGRIIYQEVTGPLGIPVQGFYGILGDGETAVIEMAAASGLDFVPREMRNPLITTTWGVGELVRSALDTGAKKIILGLGGSATNDGGAGMMQALGVKLLNDHNEQVGYGGATLETLVKIDTSEMDPRLKDTTFIVACDVDNPLTGNDGASAVFGPQKGATSQDVEQLDKALSNFAAIIKESVGIDVNVMKGAGSAGGLGAGVKAFLNSELKSGIDIVIEATGLKDIVSDADLVITGEGRIDSQTIHGKTPIGVAKTAREFGVPVIGIAGCITPDSNIVHSHGIDALFPIVPQIVTIEEALQTGRQNIERTSRNIAQIYNLGRLSTSAAIVSKK